MNNGLAPFREQAWFIDGRSRFVNTHWRAAIVVVKSPGQEDSLPLLRVDNGFTKHMTVLGTGGEIKDSNSDLHKPVTKNRCNLLYMSVTKSDACDSHDVNFS
jgi:hypothetical protein